MRTLLRTLFPCKGRRICLLRTLRTKNKIKLKSVLSSYNITDYMHVFYSHTVKILLFLSPMFSVVLSLFSLHLTPCKGKNGEVRTLLSLILKTVLTSGVLTSKNSCKRSYSLVLEETEAVLSCSQLEVIICQF